MTRWTAILFGMAAAFGVWRGSALAQADDGLARVLRAEQERIDAISRATKPSIAIFESSGKGGGSGVLISPLGYALTNYHVVKPVGSFMKCGLPDGDVVDAVVVGIDPVGDVALVRLYGRETFPVADLGDSDLVRAGDWCFTVGNPFLLATDLQPSVAWGIVSGVHRYQGPAGTLLEYADCIQTDAAINPGNSGGPLFDSRGRLIGINGRGSFEKRGRVNVGVGYAISINQIKHFLGYLHSGRIVDHATLGARVASDDRGHVVVTNILDSSDAYRRGLRYGDEIVAFGGRTITSANAFKNILGIFPKGWEVALHYRRDGKEYETTVRLAGVHRTEELFAKVQKPEKVEPPRPRRGRPIPGKPERPEPNDEDHAHASDKDDAAHPLAKYFVKRAGYSNYYFNQLEQERIWKALRSHGSFDRLTGAWKLAGSLDAAAFEISLDEEGAVATFPEGPIRLDATGDLAEELLPEGSGGLLLALHLWRRLLVEGPDRYGDIYYLGAAPRRVSAGNAAESLVDVIVATHDIVETHFLFDRQTGRLTAIEMFPDTGVDPCSLTFSEEHSVAGRSLPRRIEVRLGDTLFGVLQVDQWTLPENTEANQ